MLLVEDQNDDKSQMFSESSGVVARLPTCVIIDVRSEVNWPVTVSEFVEVNNAVDEQPVLKWDERMADVA